MKIAKNIVTLFSLGYARYCPGTLGSIVAFIIYHLLLFFFLLKIEYFFFGIFIVVIFLFYLSVILINSYLPSAKSQDPKEVIIDEFVGQFLASNLCLPSFYLVTNSFIVNKLKIEYLFLFCAIMPLLLFRFFDICKIWPIKWFEDNIKGGMGVMIDDILAAIFASIVHYAVILYFFL